MARGSVAIAADARGSAEGKYLENTQAARMMAAALERLSRENISARQLAGELGYKSTVALSHVAAGRVPVPVERCIEYARKLKMDPAQFLLATLEQRYPDVDFMRLLVGNKKNLAVGADGDDVVADDIRAAAGSSLSDLPESVRRVILEVVSDRDPSRRWLSLQAAQVFDMIRKERPELINGVMTKEQREKLRDCLRAL